MTSRNPEARTRFAQTLKAARKGRSLSQGALGELIPSVDSKAGFVAQATVHNWEHGTSLPSAEQIVLLEERLGLPPGHLWKRLTPRHSATKLNVSVIDYLPDDQHLGPRDKSILEHLYRFLTTNPKT